MDTIQLMNHLAYNFVPPIPHAQRAAEQAIEAVNNGDLEKQIVTPSGNEMPAYEIVDELHLEFFIDIE